MRILLVRIMALLSLTSCLTAPDYERDNDRDMRAGIPHIDNSRITLSSSGLLLNWTDGSLQNDLFIVEQRMYDNSSSSLDSLIKIDELEPDAIFFQDTSLELGYPFTVYLRSRIMDGTRIKAEVVDTFNIDFGLFEYRSQYTSGDDLILNWQNVTNVGLSDSVLVEKYLNNNWEFYDYLDPRTQVYSLPWSSISTKDLFRISSTVINFNGTRSRTNSFEVLVE